MGATKHGYKRLLVLPLLALAMAVSSISDISASHVPSSSSEYYSGTVYGRTPNHGYYTGERAVAGTNQDLTNTMSTSINTVSEFMTWIRNLNSNGGKDRVAARVITFTMLGYRGQDAPAFISSSHFTELQERLNFHNSFGGINWFESRPSCGVVNSWYTPSTNDVSWRVRQSSGPCTDSTIVIRSSSGAIVYELNRRCGNPMGDRSGLQNPNWIISGDSQIFRFNMVGSPLGRSVDAVPGDRFSFGHRISNDGPTNTSSTIRFTRTYTYDPNPTVTEQAFGSSIPAGWPRGATTGWLSSGNTPTITQDHVGNTYTMRVRATPRSHNGSSLLLLPLVVSVPYNYNLTPQPPARSATSAGQGETVNFSNYRVSNSGPTKSHDRPWRILKLVIKPGESTSFSQPENLANGDPYCSGWLNKYPGRFESCQSIRDGTKVFDPGTYTFTSSEVGSAGSVNTEDLPPGSHVCMTIGVQRPTNASAPTFWRFSRPSCVVVGKRPLTHVIGGDLWAGGSFPQTNGTCPSTRANVRGTSRPQYDAGSWGEYGVFALGDIQGFGTAARPHNSASPSASQRLAFSNTNPVGNYFGSSLRDHCFTDIFSDFAGSNNTSNASLSISALNGASGDTQVVRTSAQNVTIEGGSVGQSKTIVIYATNANANVTINGDVTFNSGTSNGIDKIPRVFILSNNNLTIHGNVRTIEAWLAAKGTLRTCHVTGNLTINTCNNQLTVYGPVSAGTIDLRRTFGADGTTNSSRQRPGEIFNLRPDYYLSAYNNALQNTVPRAVYQQELPPRF